jgi:hypothetical protein
MKLKAIAISLALAAVGALGIIEWDGGPSHSTAQCHYLPSNPRGCI